MAGQNWDDSTIFIGDNLKVMREMNSGHIDLIYLDPPFNSNHNYAAPIGSKAAGAEFKDTWTLQDVDEVWHGYLADKHPALYQLIKTAGEVSGDSMKSYLIYMAVRILEMKRLLKPTGSIYLHCDPTAGHYLKLAMDAVLEGRISEMKLFGVIRPAGAQRDFLQRNMTPSISILHLMRATGAIIEYR